MHVYILLAYTFCTWKLCIQHILCCEKSSRYFPFEENSHSPYLQVIFLIRIVQDKQYRGQEYQESRTIKLVITRFCLFVICVALVLHSHSKPHWISCPFQSFQWERCRMHEKFSQAQAGPVLHVQLWLRFLANFLSTNKINPKTTQQYLKFS